MHEYITNLSDAKIRVIINRLLNFYFANKRDINQPINLFLDAALSSKLIDLEDTIKISDLF